MMHLPGQLQWDCKTIKSCHKRLHLLMSATSIHSITVVTHLLKSFKLLCLTSYVGFDKLRGTDKIVYQHTRFVQEWEKENQELNCIQNFHNQKKRKIGMFDNDISHKWFHLYMPYAKIY